jgi:hypothetical protein
MIEFRKVMMKAENEKRGNPMRSVELDINLTPMDYCARASWTISRNEHLDYSGAQLLHFLHITEYDLKGEDATQYKSQEYTTLENEKAEAEVKKKQTTVLKKEFHEGIYRIEYYIANKHDTKLGEKVYQPSEYKTHTRPDGSIYEYPLRYDFLARVIEGNKADTVIEIIGYNKAAYGDGITTNTVVKAKEIVRQTWKVRKDKEGVYNLPKDLKIMSKVYDIAPLGL